jgi:hypothetical protein
MSIESGAVSDVYALLFKINKKSAANNCLRDFFMKSLPNSSECPPKDVCVTIQKYLSCHKQYK